MVTTTSTPSKNQTAASKAKICVDLGRDQLLADYFLHGIYWAISVMTLMFLIILVLHFMCLTPIPRIVVDSASFSKLNFTSSNLTVTCLVSLRVINTNPNHSVCYDRFFAVLFYGTGASKQPLDVARAPSLYKNGLGESIIRFQFELENEYVGEEVARSIISDVGARGSVDFVVQVKAQPQLDHEGKQKWWCNCLYGYKPNLKILCNPVTFGLSSQNGTGSMMVASRECAVDVDDVDDLPLLGQEAEGRTHVNGLVSTN